MRHFASQLVMPDFDLAVIQSLLIFNPGQALSKEQKHGEVEKHITLEKKEKKTVEKHTLIC